MANVIKDRAGEETYNNQGLKMKIKEYINSDNIIIEFEDGYKIKSAYKEFNTGAIRNPYYKSIFHVGYLGKGKYHAKINKIDTPQYKCWHDMIIRCYSKKRQKKQPTYIGCTVCEEWHNFQNFAKWYDENYYEIEEEKMCLDKDILVKGNKIYSPETCVFVPERINILFTKNNINRGNYPIGIHYQKKNKKYIAQCSVDKPKQAYLGIYPTIEEAFLVYKKFKEDYIKQIANNYINKIPHNLYEALINYVVEITD